MKDNWVLVLGELMESKMNLYSSVAAVIAAMDML